MTKYKHLLYSLLIVFHYFNVFSQNTDSLKVIQYLIQSNKYVNINKEISLQYNDSAVLLSKQLDNPVLLSKSYRVRSNHLYENPITINEAFLWALKSIDILEKNNLHHRFEKELASSYFLLGSIYSKTNKFKESKEAYQKSLSLYASPTDSADIQFNLGVVYFNQYTENKNKKFLDTATDLIKKSTDLYIQLNDTDKIIVGKNNLGAFYFSNEKYKEALTVFKTLQSILESKKLLDELIINYNNISNTFEFLQQYDSAIYYINQALDLSEKTGNTSYLKDIYIALSALYEKKGDFKKALYFSRAESMLKDSIYSVEKIKKMEEMNAKYQTSVKEKENLILKEKYAKQKIINWLIASIAFFIVVFTIFIYRNLRIRNKLYQILKINKEIIEKRNSEIIDSIQYAQRIQKTFLQSSEQFIQKYFSKYFLFYLPKDIVSGDFYFTLQFKNYLFIGVFDCTGHGVPGAFMSILNFTLLNKAIKENNILDTDKIFNFIRSELTERFSQYNVQDGMDGILTRIDLNDFQSTTKKIQYSSANSFPIIIRNNEVQKLEYSKMPIGLSYDTELFSSFNIEVSSNDILVLSTDGYKDQFGGEKNKRIGNKNFLEILKTQITDIPKQSETNIISFFNKWKNKNEQTDDVTLLALYF